MPTALRTIQIQLFLMMTSPNRFLTTSLIIKNPLTLDPPGHTEICQCIAL